MEYDGIVRAKAIDSAIAELIKLEVDESYLQGIKKYRDSLERDYQKAFIKSGAFKIVAYPAKETPAIRKYLADLRLRLIESVEEVL